MVHVRAVLGTVMPVVQARTADVRGELNRIRGLRAQAEAAVGSFREGRARLESERVSLVRLEAEHRLNARNLDKSALVESDKAIALGEQARDIADQMQTAGQAAALQADLQALPGPLPRPQSDDGAGRPAARGGAPYKLPVPGQIVTGLGELSTSGARARGITLAPPANADAIAPAGGKILYASGFRDYGGIVIIDHGNGWTSAITGLAQVGVRKGDAVVQGQLIGRVGGDSPRLTVELRRRGRPMDLTQLLD
jgi:septal ring factor EnvC (AmiA/AmiB activator)